MQSHTLALKRMSTLLYNLGEVVVEGVAEAYMAHHAALKEGERPDALCAVDDLVRNHKVPGSYLFLQAPDGGEGDYSADTDRTQRCDIGTVFNFVRRELMVQAVT